MNHGLLNPGLLNPAQLAFRHRLVTWVTLGALMALGLLAMYKLPRREDPDLQSRFIQVIAPFPGASASQVEQLLTERTERALLEVNDVKTVRSTSRDGVATFVVEAADQAHDMKKFRDDLRQRVTDLSTDLPAGAQPMLVNDRFGDTAAVIIGVTWQGATDRQRQDVAESLRDRLRPLPDVAEVKLLGTQQESIRVALSAQRLSQYAVTPAQVADAIARRNVLPLGGGSVALGSARLNLAPSGDLHSLGELENLVVATANGQPVYLRDVAEVRRDYQDPSPFIVRVNGQPAVAVTVTMRSGRNITELGHRLDSTMSDARKALPAGAALTVVNDLPLSVDHRMGEFSENLISGVVLIFIVMYFFMGLRSALLVGVMLPITVLGTFAMMWIFNRDIQQISITALIIALGLVVDNSIVVVDNIERKMAAGLDRERAAIEGTDELKIPLLTSNLTTVASFAPLLLLSGAVGEFIRDLGIVTSLATLVSLAFNYTVAPLIAARYLGSQHEALGLRKIFNNAIDRLRDALSALAQRGLTRPALTVGLAVAALTLAAWEMPRLGTQFFPSAVRNQFTVDVWLPEGRDITATSRVTGRVEQHLRDLRGVVSTVSYIGQGGPRFYYNVNPEPPTANYAQIVVNTASVDDTRRLVAELQARCDADISEARVVARTLEQGPPVGAPVAIRLTGDDVTTLRQAGDQVKALLASVQGTRSVYHDYGEIPLGLGVKVDADQAALAGLSSADVAHNMRLAYSGQTASMWRDGEHEIPIEVRVDSRERGSAESLDDLYMPTAAGPVPLRQIATVALTPQDGVIQRRNHVRTLTVYAFTDGTRLASRILDEAQRRIAATRLPAGVHVSYGGEQEEVDRTFTEMLVILGLTVILNMVIVAWEFSTMRATLAILAAVPLSLSGAVLGLWLMGLPFGFMAFLGITSLGGVVTNHAIVLFEYAHEEQRRGMPLDEALLVAGRKRLRPILLTVLLSIGGLLPQAFNGGTLWPPMAWSLIFGLAASLVLTLVVVPSVYKMLDTLAIAGVRLPRFEAWQHV
jgi:multidrug efflux pump subunit AcrB